jgi:SH2 domain-containing protein 4A
MSAWFHGAISRWEAERRLTNQPAGAFLARLTERLWGYAISVRNPSGSVSHFLIDAGEKRSHKKYTLLGSTDPPHKSLRKSMIRFENYVSVKKCHILVFCLFR